MLSPEDIRTRVHQEPFAPFRIVTSSGQMFDIMHPELIMVGRRALILGTASTENPATFEQVTQVALMHVTALEPLPTSAPGGGNGQQ